MAKADPLFKAGNTHQVNDGEIIITHYKCAREVSIKFTESGFENVVTAGDIRNRQVRDKLKASVCGMGFVGGNHYTYTNSTEAYISWAEMIRRCYSNEYKEKAPTYENCTSCREWLNFQVFAKWYHLNRLSDDVKYQLDKDIINRGNKVYSPENCALVPRHINNIILDNKLKRGELPIGVFSSGKRFMSQLKKRGVRVTFGSFATKEEAAESYINEKRKYLKDTATKSYSRGEVSHDIFIAISNWKVGE